MPVSGRWSLAPGIHGLPLPISCTHGTSLFLPWHRAYLYYFEQYLLDVMPAGQAVGLPWWDWSAQTGIPASYAAPDLPGGGPNPLPSAAEVAAVLRLEDFDDFSGQLEDLHNRVHVWVGGTMSEIPVAAFDPLFWAHHTMIDRLWAIWQQAHPPEGRRPFDFRAEHQLTPMSKNVIVTERLRGLVRPGAEFTVRIVPFVRPDHAGALPDSLVADLLQLERVELLTYQ